MRVTLHAGTNEASSVTITPDVAALTPELATACRELLEGGVFELGTRANKIETRMEALEVQCVQPESDE